MPGLPRSDTATTADLVEAQARKTKTTQAKRLIAGELGETDLRVHSGGFVSLFGCQKVRSICLHEARASASKRQDESHHMLPESHDCKAPLIDMATSLTTCD